MSRRYGPPSRVGPWHNPYWCPDQRLTTVRSSPGGGGEGCARHSNWLLDAVPGGERPAGWLPPGGVPHHRRLGALIHPWEAGGTFAGSFVSFWVGQASRLTAIVPPNFPLGIDKEFMLTSFHLRACLRRASLMVSGKRRQVAFCPYCGVTNDNTETGLNHVRKHLDVMLVCGGCHTKSVCLGQALQKHMKDNCPAVLAILGKTRGGRR